MTTDKITTIASTITIVSGSLAASNVYPQFFGLIAAIAHAINGFYTNKPNKISRS
jgi:hypothetical protein